MLFTGQACSKQAWTGILQITMVKACTELIAHKFAEKMFFRNTGAGMFPLLSEFFQQREK